MITYYNPVKILFGSGTLTDLGILLTKYEVGKHILIVCGKKAMKKQGILQQVRTTIENEGKKAYIYDEVSSNPSIVLIEDAVDRLISAPIECIIGLGGGSAMDVAKSLSYLLYHKEHVTPYLKEKKPFKKNRLSLIQIPTTAGTGSEVTKWATIWDNKNKKKYSFSNTVLYADIAIVDPELTLSLPPHLTAITGLDALSHAIEAFWSKNHNPLSDTHAIKAITLILDNIIHAYHNPDSLEYRKNMLLASLESGLAFSNTKTTAVHSISYPLTAQFNVPHGLACAILLGDFFVFNSQETNSNLPETPARLKKLVKIFGCNDPIEVKTKIIQLLEKMGLPSQLSDLGVAPTDIDLLLTEGFTKGRIDNNPRQITKEDLKNILQSFFSS